MGVNTENPAFAENSDRGRLEAVRRATKTWTGQLVDLTGRNNLLYYRDLKVGTLPLDSCPRQVVHNALAGRSVRLSSLFPDEEERADAIKRARSVRNKANAHFEERGMETLYLACGMATWSGQKSAATPSAPVLLVPIRLAAKGAAQEEFELTVTGELEVNPTFLQMLKAEFEIGCDPADLLQSAGIQGIIDTPEELDVAFAWLRKQCLAVPSFEVQERFVVGNFSYARMPMVLDLENSLEAMAEHDIVAALAGDNEAQAALGYRLRLPLGFRVLAQRSTSPRNHTGVARRRATGSGKSARFAHRRSCRVEVPSAPAASASPSKSRLVSRAICLQS